jgi:23S rRNA (pseudouridine1915-N3)-methyltransferase
MTITILCPSPLVKDNAIKTIADDYIKRLHDKVVIQELNVKTKTNDVADLVKQKQGDAIVIALSKLSQNTAIIALDERGKSYDSRQIATQLSHYKNDGLSDVCIIIGGAFGLSQDVLKKSHMRLSLGTMVWPHRLVFVMILEQLYRSQQINMGHPYHKD